MATEIDFELNGEEFRMTRLNAMKQFHLSRRIAPLIPPLIPVYAEVSKQLTSDKSLNIHELPELIQPLADALGEMTDEQAEYVFNLCLSALKVKRNDAYVSVWNPAAKMMNFEDMNNVAKILPLVVRVIMETLGSFTQGLLTGQPVNSQPAA